ncbi:MAG: DUF3953 domain-containing protein [Clostridium sp.]|nr:DUF3953 domain-containing protein [Clostridium sp.]
MIKTPQKIFAIMQQFRGVVGLIFPSSILTAFMLLSSGSMLLAMGIGEIIEERKQMGILLFGVTIFVFYVAISIFNR